MSQSVKHSSAQAPSDPPARRGKPHGAAETALREAGNALARAGFMDATLVLRWEEIAGVQLSRIAQPVKLQEGPEGGVLTLKCEAGTVVFLQHETRGIVERVNAYLGRGRIVRIRLVPGRFSTLPELPDHPQRGRPKLVKLADQQEKPAIADALKALAALRARRRR